MKDEDAMHKVIVNLIGNTKFTPKGGQITIYATPSARKSRKACSSVSGIRGPWTARRRDRMKSIPNRFYQSQNKTHSLSTDKAGPESASIYANELSSCMEVQFVPRIIRAKDVLSVFYFLCNMPMQTVCPHQQSKLKNR